jgi:cytochrome c oxidase subunit 2
MAAAPEGKALFAVVRTRPSRARKVAGQFTATSFSVLAIVALSGMSGATADAGVPTLTIHAVRYQFDPAEITLKKGQPVRLVFTADDVAHGISIPDLGVHLDLPKHKEETVIVTPRIAGDFDGECSKYCGTGHSGMTFLVHVTPE